MVARHASPLEALLVDERFDGEINPFEPMSRHTTHFASVGRLAISPASTLVGAARVPEARPWAEMVHRRPGLETLVADEGVDAAVIVLGRDFRSMRYDEEKSRLMLGAGVPLSAAVQEAFRRSLAGLEFAVGTPGSVGGALRMNAGSRDEWLGARVESVTSFSAEGGLVRRHGSEIEWGYRCSSFPADEILVECELNTWNPPTLLHQGEDGGPGKPPQGDLGRCASPPVGSVSRTPKARQRAILTERAGLKGSAVGGAHLRCPCELHREHGECDGPRCCRSIELVQGGIEAYGVALKPEVKPRLRIGVPRTHRPAPAVLCASAVIAHVGLACRAPSKAGARVEGGSVRYRPEA